VIALLIALLLLPSRFFTGADAGGRPDSGGGAGDALTRPEDSRTGPHLTSQRRAAENGAEPTAARSRTAKRLGVKLRQAGQAWGGAVRGCSRDHPETLWQAVLLTLVLYFNKCLMGYVIAVAMGMHAPFWSVMGAQILLIFICYFAPTPGASFIAEISNSYLMGWVAGPEKIVLYTAFVRTSAVWLAVILGGIFLARQLRRDADLWLSRRD